MSEAAGEFSVGCPSEEIGAYLDAELPPERVAALEDHFAACAVCRDELNSQKAFLLELNRSLESAASLELPKNFAKAIATKAESSVTGLRQRSERIAAFSIMGALLILSAMGFAGDPAGVYAGATRPLGSVAAFLDVAVGLIYGIVFAVGFFAKKVFSGTAGASILVILILIAAVVSVYVFRRYRRTASAG